MILVRKGDGMGDFTSLSLPKTLDTSTADIIEDFFVPVLAHATRYDRGVGFFSSVVDFVQFTNFQK